MKKIVAVLIALPILLCLTLFLLSYQGAKAFSESGDLPDIVRVIENARSLRYTPYDPLMGKYDNIGGKLGFIVCSDVPNIAYGLSGYSLQVALADDFKRNPKAYDSADGNTPRNPFFHRRARNLYAYFESTRRLMPPGYRPQAGDLVFYKKAVGAYISHVALVTEADADSYRIMESAPGTLLAQEVDKNSPRKRGWVLIGFGKMY
ncbi:DUF1287 domain-containing protein [Microbulbifer sp. OS29]|uniref:DUF1287 domain-containing protein n=1 Tax=Microbulbifer okhotskensis TaxID=2926617 RepID=A0A9X2ES65_9GAMM|nr:DUF1287 domain-containing protein [Microbulbifer okhotskensis]MCO1334778.1 DUF1287 domain-containing protein [Microbulbifer okhotskensis]